MGDAVAVGSTVQFQVRDADSAHEDLMGLMTGQAAHGALLFTCNGRGSHLFSKSSHDATVVSELLDSVPISGMFCDGEIGPVGNRSLNPGAAQTSRSCLTASFDLGSCSVMVPRGAISTRGSHVNGTYRPKHRSSSVMAEVVATGTGSSATGFGHFHPRDF